MIGPIESKFDQVKRTNIKKLGRLGLEEVDQTATYLLIHLGSRDTVRGKLLSAFEIVRAVFERHERGEMVQPADLRQQLLDQGHLSRERWFERDQQMFWLSKAYLLDRPAIDRTLDFRRARLQGEI